VYQITEANEIFPKIEWTYTDDAFKAYAPDSDNKRYHEAGYDAFITGVTYIKSWKLMDP